MTKLPEYYSSPRTSVNLTAIATLQLQRREMLLPRELIPAWEENNLWRCGFLAGMLAGKLITADRWRELKRGISKPKTEEEKLLVRFVQLLKESPWQQEKKLTSKAVAQVYETLIGVGAKSVYKKTALAELLEWLNEDSHTHPLVRAGVALKTIVEDQIFSTENEITARLITLLLMAHWGYRTPATFVMEDYDLLSPAKYQGRLERPCGQDFAPWLDYFIKGIRFGLQVSVDQALTLQETVIRSKKLTPAQVKIWEQLQSETSAKNLAVHAKILGVSKQRAHVLITELVNKGVMERLGTGKKITYRLAWKKWN